MAIFYSQIYYRQQYRTEPSIVFSVIGTRIECKILLSLYLQMGMSKIIKIEMRRMCYVIRGLIHARTKLVQLSLMKLFYSLDSCVLSLLICLHLLLLLEVASQLSKLALVSTHLCITLLFLSEHKSLNNNHNE